MNKFIVTQEKETPTKYEQPAIIYDGSITTRAGSPLGNGDGSGSNNGADGVDPADLFD